MQATIQVFKERMLETTVGEIIPKEELEDLVPPHFQHIKHYIFVARAREQLNEEFGYVFETMKGQGYQRLANADGSVSVGKSTLKAVRLKARRGAKFASRAIETANDATPSQRRTAFQQISTLGIIEHLSMEKTVKTLPEEKPATYDGMEGIKRALGID